METTNFAEIEPTLQERILAMVWCNMATVDHQNRPRSRVVQPIWEGATIWIATRRDSHKARHIANNPAVSLAYVVDNAAPVYVDGVVRWVDDLAIRQHVWTYAQTLPDALRYDLTPMYTSPDNPQFGLLELVPSRIDVPGPNWQRLVWRPART